MDRMIDQGEQYCEGCEAYCWDEAIDHNTGQWETICMACVNIENEGGAYVQARTYKGRVITVDVRKLRIEKERQDNGPLHPTVP